MAGAVPLADHAKIRSMNEEQLRAELAAVYASRSWRITAPLRWVVSFSRRLILLLRHPKRIPGILLRVAGRSPLVRRAGGRFLMHVSPALYTRVQQALFVPPVSTVSYLQPNTFAAAVPDRMSVDQDESAARMDIPCMRISAQARIVFAEIQRIPSQSGH